MVIKLTSYYCFCPFPYSDWYRKKFAYLLTYASSHRLSNIDLKVIFRHGTVRVRSPRGIMYKSHWGKSNAQPRQY